MIEGTLIAESLRVGTSLEKITLTVRKISRYRAQGTTPTSRTSGASWTSTPMKPARRTWRGHSPMLWIGRAGT